MSTNKSNQKATVPNVPSLAVPPVKLAGFMAEASRSSIPIDVRMTGNADSLVLADLESFLRTLHKETCRSGASEVRLDVSELFFMNSSCMKLFVSWFTLLRELDPPQQYRVVVQSSPKLHWQARSFDALRYIANGLVTVS
jgi:hypothetical protein